MVRHFNFLSPNKEISILCRHMQRFWGASGDFWQSQWENICGFFGNEEFNIGVMGTFFVTFIVYWFIGLLYTFIDYTGKPRILMKYKIQNTPLYPVRIEYEKHCFVM